MNSPRVVFMGSPAFAVPTLTQLSERPDVCEVVGVVTQPDRPAGRGRKVTPSAVKVAATARGIAVLEPTQLHAPATLDRLRELAPDVIVVAAYGRILRSKILTLPLQGCINVHASILPRHRGASPIAHAIVAGDAETGVSIMRMEAGLDTGPVYRTDAISIDPSDTCGTLTVKLAELGGRLMVETLPEICAGQLQPTPQDDNQATYAPLLEKSDGLIDWSQSAVEVARRVRGFTPWPGAIGILGETRVQILEARAVEGRGEVGRVGAVTADGVVVSCGEGALLLETVKPAGKRAMPAVAWVAGRGAQVGDLFSRP